MYGVITSQNYCEDIFNSLEQKPHFLKEGNGFDEETFLNHIQSASRLTLKVLIVDVTCVSEAGLLKGIRQFRVQKPTVRIVLIAPGYLPGNTTISSLVALGIHDIIAPSIPQREEDESNQEEIEFDISPYIKERLLNPGTYADVVRWHTLYEIESVESKSESIDKLAKIIKPKIEVKTEYVVEQKFITIPNNTIAVVNLSNKAGSSFVTMNLAKVFETYNLSVSILDNPLFKFGKTRLFDTLGLEFKEAADSEFYSIPHEINQNKKIERDKIISSNNINWMVTDSRQKKIENWTYEEMLKYMHASKSTVTLIDIGYISQEEQAFTEIIQEVDLVLIIIDPIPQDMLANMDLYNYFTNLQEQGANIEFVFNRWNEGVNIKHLKETGIDVKSAIKIPFVAPELIYRAIYECYIPCDDEEVRNLIEDPLFQLITMVFPTIEKHKKNFKKGFTFKRLLQWNKTE